jgi:hypothetical protein
MGKLRTDLKSSGSDNKEVKILDINGNKMVASKTNVP